MTLPFDKLGIIASVLCMIHCVGTPFVFVAKACSISCCSDSPVWWQLIDYFFLIICFFVICRVNKESNKAWLKVSFWTSWIVLTIMTLNQTFNVFPISLNLTYVPACSIIALHFYNIHFCKCSNGNR